MAKLPRKYLDIDKIANMVPGDVRYTVPWAMFVDEKGECWLHPLYSAEQYSGGTVEMRIELTEEGFVVTADGLDFSWSTGASMSSYGSAVWLKPIPVHEVI